MVFTFSNLSQIEKEALVKHGELWGGGSALKVVLGTILVTPLG